MALDPREADVHRGCCRNVKLLRFACWWSLGVATHISRTPALGESRCMCHICVYCQEVKAGRPITVDNGVTFHWCQNKNAHISKHNGYDCTIRCFNGSLESFPFLLSYTARFLIENSPLVSCQDPEQNVHGLAFLMAPHFDGPNHLLRAICRRFSELGAIRHAKRWAISLVKKERTFGFNKSRELLCLLTEIGFRRKT